MKPEHIETEKYHRPFLVGRGRAFETVLWTAWRKVRPKVKGYGMTEDQAINDLVHHVQPDWNSTLDPQFSVEEQPARGREPG